MIHPQSIGYVLGQFLLGLAATMLIPIGFGALDDRAGLEPLGYAFGITLACGLGLMLLLKRPTAELNQREGLLMVVAIWVAVGVFGSLPFYFSPYFAGFTDAFFEAISGFSTTGATVLENVAVLPNALQFWRCFSHWIGGMGIVLLGVAILPLVGHGGMQLYRAEFSGAKSEKLKPRIQEAAFSLWKIYFALTIIQFAALRMAGMNAFEAMCHTFSTLGTGGFSTRTESIAAFQSPVIEYILIFFMLIAGMSFVQQYRLWVEGRPGTLFRDFEIRHYAAIIAITSILIAFIIGFDHGYGAEKAFRTGLFQVTSIMTTTGFATDDFGSWHPLPQLILLALMFVGGCTGSTAGGLKTSRIVLLSRVVDREFKRMVERRGVFAVRVGDTVVSEPTIQSLLNLVYLAFLVNFVSCLLLAAVGLDVLTAISAVAASMFNVGPGLGGVGPAENYGHLPVLAKWVLAGCMIAGRLEFYTVLVILTPAFWRK